MSRRATRRSVANVEHEIMMIDDDDDDMDTDPSFTQPDPAPSQATMLGSQGGEMKSANRLDRSFMFISQWSTDERHRKIKDVIRLALFCQHAQVPLKREDITKKILNDPKAYPAIMKLAQDYLNDVFGFELVPLETHERSHRDGTAANKATQKKTNSSSAAANAFVVTSTLSMQERRVLLSLESQVTPANSLLLTILTLILVSGRTIREDALDAYLRRLDIHKQRKHATFGDIPTVLATFIKQGYLDRVKTGRGENEVVTLVWGPRAKAEFADEHIAQFICHFYPEHSNAEKNRLAQDIISSNSS